MTDQPSRLLRILADKRVEVARHQQQRPLAMLQAECSRSAPPRSLGRALRQPRQGRTALIAEVKKASPSRGVLREPFDHLAIAQIYLEHGASALSVLTDEPYFQGSLAYLQAIRAMQERTADDVSGADVPLLRKDFLIDPYQLYEARACGADAVLLIVAALDDAQLHDLLQLTHALHMEALVEVHDETEMERALAAGATILGINNRNLHTFETTLATTERLIAALPTMPERPLLVSESGIHTPDDVARVRHCGVQAILVGESLVRADDIGAKVRSLVAA
ncbi:MAG: indole-3-glycerol phosphate synthase TrpC [Chloroflexaceae bacterium]|nr:indole-3-glycerol phosphate synthase TrpC [Chloroflexaceae bacterium]